MTFETFDQSDKVTWPGQYKDKDKDNSKVKRNDEGNKNLVEIENHLDCISAHLRQPIIERGQKLNPPLRLRLVVFVCVFVSICLFLFPHQNITLSHLEEHNGKWSSRWGEEGGWDDHDHNHDLTMTWLWPDHDNLCYLTIKSDTGQHSQFLRCLVLSLRHDCSCSNKWESGKVGKIDSLKALILPHPYILRKSFSFCCCCRCVFTKWLMTQLLRCQVLVHNT